jgi:hypothetical protein
MANEARRLLARILPLIAGAMILAGCGGSSNVTTSSSDHTSASSTPTVSGTPASSSTVGSGTMLKNNAASRIVDKAQTVWTVKSGVVYQQPAGAASTTVAGYSANVQLLFYYNGVVY